MVTFVGFPLLCLTSLARTDRAALVAGAWVPGVAFLTHAVAALLAWPLARLATPDLRRRRTFVFAVAVGNWIFLPLPLAVAEWGSPGETVVLLHNVGAQLFLWTAGVAILGHRGASLGAFARNPGLLATALGVGLSLGAPRIDASLVHATAGAATWLAGLTIPLATFGIGVQLADLGPAPAEPRAIALVLLARMGLSPIVVALALAFAGRLGAGLGEVAVDVEILIAAMPVSVSAAAVAESYGGDAGFAARATAVSTLAAAVWVPLVLAYLA